MALYKISDFDPNYRDTFQGTDVKGMGVYTEGNEKIGSVSDILVDNDGRFRYFIVDLGFWIFGKKVLLPVGRTRVDYGAGRIHALNMSREQAENLPEYNERQMVDYDYEERVRNVYRTSTGYTRPVEESAPLEASAPLDAATRERRRERPAYNRESYTYAHEPELYDLTEQDHQNLKLYEERLVASKRRTKTGEVAIGKHVETETARVAVPLEKERVVIERVTPEEAGQPVAPGEANFREGEVAHMDIYEETPDIRKEAVVREEVRVHKEVERDTAEVQDTIRREELDIDAPNLPQEER